jgi:hypothetical protein
LAIADWRLTDCRLAIDGLSIGDCLPAGALAEGGTDCRLATARLAAGTAAGDPQQVYTAAMDTRLAAVTGTAATVVAGILLGVLSLSAFGAAPTLLGFLTLFLLARVTQRTIARNR